MIYLTQIIYIREGQEQSFHEFEDIALPLIKKYGGSLVLRVRPSEECVIAREGDKPYEIHVVTFPDDASLERFSQDEHRRAFLHLKEQSVKSVLLVRGSVDG
jgi:uncharacterized protein (DUF1330 family)